MNWRTFIYGMYAKQEHGDGLESKALFHPPASIQELADLESQVGTSLPADLRSVLLETNGVMSTLKIDDGDWFENMWLLWPTYQIINDNLLMRRESAAGEYEGPFQDLLVFANAGTDGILFANPIEHRVAAPNIMAWF